MNGVRYGLIGLLLIIALSLMVLRGGRYLGEQPVQHLPYNEFLALVERQQVAELEFRDEFRRIVGRTRDDVHFTTDATGDPQVVEWVHQKAPKTTIHNNTSPGFERWTGLLSMAVIVLLVLGVLWALMLRQGGGGQQAFSFGQSRARRFNETMSRKTFQDVAGAQEAKEELVEIVDFLKHSEKYRRLGAEVPRGVLLLGPPGCGKTLLARAVAGEANVPFFHISGSDFVELFVGVGASRVRDLFTKAKASKPCIVFIDEIDAVGRQRGAGLGGGHDEREQTLNQLLVEMDGFEPNTGIILIAATNRPDILDPALLRPGRFDRRVVVDVPDYHGRKEILQLYIGSKPMVPEVDVDVLARQTPGFTGADLANLVNEAAILAARGDKQTIDMADLQEAIERVMAGPERRSRLINDEEKQLIAYHEVGHAVVSRMLRHGLQVHKITILPRGLALGYVMQLPKADRHLVTQSALEDEITATLGGRAAEEVFFSERTTGARQDLEQVTEVARAMVCEYGMSEVAGARTLGRRHGPVFLGRDIYEDRDYSEEMAEKIDTEIHGIVDRCYRRARDILADNREAVESVVHSLLERETLTGAELDQLLEDAGVELPEQVPFPWSGMEGWPPSHTPAPSTAAPAAEAG